MGKRVKEEKVEEGEEEDVGLGKEESRREEKRERRGEGVGGKCQTLKG